MPILSAARLSLPTSASTWFLSEDQSTAPALPCSAATRHLLLALVHRPVCQCRGREAATRTALHILTVLMVGAAVVVHTAVVTARLAHAGLTTSSLCRHVGTTLDHLSQEVRRRFTHSILCTTTYASMSCGFGPGLESCFGRLDRNKQGSATAVDGSF